MWHFCFSHFWTFSANICGLHFEISQKFWNVLGLPLAILHKPSYKTNISGKDSITVSAINAWNNSKVLKISLRYLSPNKIKKILSDAYFAKYWNKLSTFRYFKFMLDGFSNLASLIFVLIFSPCCCYFIIHIFLSSLPLVYWTKLLLLSTQLSLHEIVPIQSKVLMVSFTKNSKGNTSRFGYAVQVLPSDKTIISKHKI